jgi:hypothetical protein
MKASFRHQWALKIVREYRISTPAMATMPYLMLVVSVILGVNVLLSIKNGDWKFSLVILAFFVALSFLFLERRAFSELLAARDEEIQKLKDNSPVKSN